MITLNEEMQAIEIQPKGYIFDNVAENSTQRNRKMRLKRKLSKYANNPAKIKLAVEYAKLQTKRDMINDRLKELKIQLES